MLIAASILILTYIGVIFTRLPHVNIDRPAAALTGALLMVLFKVVTFQQALQAIDFHTMALLFGMMLLITALQQADFFTLIAARSVSIATKPWQLLAMVVITTAVCSALLVNDVVVLLFTPVIIQACRTLKINPVPYLIAEAMAANIGSVATIVGNPQNMLIGVTSGISFIHFLLYLLPVAIVSILILLVVIYLFYRYSIRQELQREELHHQSLAILTGLPSPAARNRLLTWTIPILVLTILFLFLTNFIGLSIPMIAMAGGVAAVLFSRTKPSRLIQNVDWSLLVFFGGLFVVIGGATHAGVLNVFIEHLQIQPDITGIVSMHVFSTLISQVVSNVPLTMLVIPLINQVPGDVLWISLASGSTIGGNATIIGAVANIIVVEQAYRQGVKIGWWEFTRIGLVVTVLTIAASIGILVIEFNFGFLK
jgi:Na+/H+ antiporter NhaD/arsenite permease-like protein